MMVQEGSKLIYTHFVFMHRILIEIFFSIEMFWLKFIFISLLPHITLHEIVYTAKKLNGVYR